ncbi:hypothetical protein KQX63_18425 [Rhodopseudomonas palustris]|uniref:hypothetical protein n=1 Tax=Rhodopseudomonas palustris TaxID=1076 RepID=UPI0021F2A60F|nr:hypothetical protein [Rhodopseudomonas palustris]UYO43342.1 hypothetical protein KQX63_18425 [Rhodopseudomonas palustris]
MTSEPTRNSREEFGERLSRRLFLDKNVIQNNFRGELVEEIVNSAIGQTHGGEWDHCSGDWGAWDFRNGDLFLQVKQSAARQSWDDPSIEAPLRPITFGIAPNSGAYGKTSWVSFDGKDGRPGSIRISQIYIFAVHGDRSVDADNFDIGSWEFYVVLSNRLDELDGRVAGGTKKSISQNEIEKLVEQDKARRGKFEELRRLVSQAASEARNEPGWSSRSDILRLLEA